MNLWYDCNSAHYAYAWHSTCATHNSCHFWPNWNWWPGTRGRTECELQCGPKGLLTQVVQVLIQSTLQQVSTLQLRGKENKIKACTHHIAPYVGIKRSQRIKLRAIEPTISCRWNKEKQLNTCCTGATTFHWEGFGSTHNIPTVRHQEDLAQNNSEGDLCKKKRRGASSTLWTR